MMDYYGNEDNNVYCCYFISYNDGLLSYNVSEDLWSHAVESNHL